MSNFRDRGSTDSGSKDSCEPSAEKKIPGIGCPRCKNFIPVPISDLADRKDITCPHCGLRITNNRRS